MITNATELLTELKERLGFERVRDLFEAEMGAPEGDTKKRFSKKVKEKFPELKSFTGEFDDCIWTFKISHSTGLDIVEYIVNQYHSAPPPESV